MVENIKKQWFLMGLVLVFAAVVWDPTRVLERLGNGIKAHYGPEIMIVVIFILSGLMLDSEQIKSGIRDLKATAASLFLILAAAPFLAWSMTFYPMDTGLAVGLFIVSVMPTTLSSGVVMTKTAGGNMAHALFVTVVSNCIAIFSIPVVLSWLMSTLDIQTQMTIDKGRIIFKLLILVLLPLLTGMGMKSTLLKNKNLGKYRLQVINQVMILSIVFVSVAAARHVFAGSVALFAKIICLTAIFHLLLLGVAVVVIKILKCRRGQRESILFMGAQKTLPLSVMIQVTYFNELGAALAVCVCHHIVHLIIDGYISTRLGHSNCG